MIDLSTTYMGFRLKNPLIASSSPMTEDLEVLRRLEEAGIAAVVLPSLFEEQITRESEMLDYGLSYGEESFAEALRYFPDLQDYNMGPQGYLEHIRRAKAALCIPVIASLNGVTTGGWIRYARLMEEAGADALELNLYYLPTSSEETSQAVEEGYIRLVRDVTSSVRIPVALKLSPYFSSLPYMARRFEKAGAKALVLFNRFYQPDIDLETLEVVPNLVLSSSHELRERLRWAAILHPQVRLDLAITGGVHTAEDVLKAMMVGARVVTMASALLLHGPEYVQQLLEDIRRWMEEHEYSSIQQMQGSMSRQRVASPAAYERANYMRVLSSFEWRIASMG
ncbi:MAG: dihydroorotate dehydrogenase-like protein [Thermoflexus sp.]|nr:dihydroorotate dehydrogenase-like protein [Thermoflexus sp.]